MNNIPIEEMPREIERLLEENERLEETLKEIKEYIEINYETHWQSDMLIEIKNKINKTLGEYK